MIGLINLHWPPVIKRRSRNKQSNTLTTTRHTTATGLKGEIYYGSDNGVKVKDYKVAVIKPVSTQIQF